METNSSEESFLPKGREAEELRNPENSVKPLGTEKVTEAMVTRKNPS
jgi:hypothetical protein